jgi:hypothetical protein
MRYATSEEADAQRRRRRLIAAVKKSQREVRRELSLFNRHVGASLDLKDVDMDCLDLINRHGPLSPSDLADAPGCTPPPPPASSTDWSGPAGSPALRNSSVSRREAIRISQARGLPGVPSVGHCRAAAMRASCTVSSAASK